MTVASATLPRRALSRPSRRQRVASFGTTVLVAALLVFAVVSVQALVSQTSFRMRELDRRAAALQRTYSRLKLEVAELSSPARITAEARRLGLRLPEVVRTLHVAAARSTSPQREPGEASFALKRVLGRNP